MCFGPEVAAVLPWILGGAAVSAAGSAFSNADAEAIARDQAKARNLVLSQTLLKNDKIANDARSAFDANQQTYNAPAVADRQANAEADRMADAESTVALPEALPTTADSPDIVNQEVAKRLAAEVAKGKQKAAAAAKLGSFGDQWFQAGLGTAQAAREVDTQSGMAAGNLGLLSPLQDLAELKATRSRSPIGAILQGVGSTIGSAAGAGWLK